MADKISENASETAADSAAETRAEKNNPEPAEPSLSANTSVEQIDAVPAVPSGLTTQTHEEKVVAQHHVSKILDDVLEEEPPPVEARKSRLRHLLLLDLVLAAGLLLSTAGFTIGLFKMYITHSAQQSLMEHNYQAAIEILRGNPLPPFFSMDGNDPDDLLAQALYLDAIKRLDEDSDVIGGLKELQQIRPGSRYFTLAQQLLSEKFVPADTQLQGSVEEEAAAETKGADSQTQEATQPH